jgi:hypothetical protein
MRSIAPGDEITMSYVSLDENRTERLENLKERYSIDCHCGRCEHHLDRHVDYERCNTLVQQSVSNMWSEGRFLVGGGPPRSYDHQTRQESIKSFTDFVSISQQKYGEYHPMVTIALFLCRNTMIPPGTIHRSQMKQVLQSIATNAVITHGSDHPLFAETMAFLSDYQ